MSIKVENIGKRSWKTLEDIVVSSLGYRITVKKGLETDFASIPQIFWSIIGAPTTGLYLKPSIVHDALYMSEAVERSEADAIFLDLMKQQGVSWLKRNIMYSAVRVGGMFVWNSHKPDTVLENKQYIRIER
jgi:hypothetical protein